MTRGMNDFKPFEPQNFPTGPMTPFQIYLKQGGQANHISHTDNIVISIIYSFTYTNISVRIH